MFLTCFLLRLLLSGPGVTVGSFMEELFPLCHITAQKEASSRGPEASLLS